jgi:8-oxo-dGTP pyrophosphatase MutT (NUDIX family)
VAENPWITHETTVPYENTWIRVEHSSVTTPGGSEGIYGVVRFKNRAVGVVPIDDDDHTWLVGQYRYSLDEYSWEIPAGGCPEGETPENTALRELFEETGLTAETLTPVLSEVRLTNSVTDETAWSYLATGLTLGQAEPEDTEELAVMRLPMDEAIAMVLDGRINDAFTIMTMLRIHADRTAHG